MARIGSDNASKLFQLNKRIGIAIAGLAFLFGNEVPKNISKFVERFKRENDIEKLDVKNAAEKLHGLFNEKYNWKEQIEKMSEKIKTDLQRQGCEILEMKQEQYQIKFRFKDPQGDTKTGVGEVETISILVAGYNEDGSHEVYVAYILGENQKKRDSKERGKEYGASWIGQNDVCISNRFRIRWADWKLEFSPRIN